MRLTGKMKLAKLALGTAAMALWLTACGGTENMELETTEAAQTTEAQTDGDASADEEGLTGMGVPLKEGDTAPDFTAQLVDGSTVTLSDLKGKPVLINFWATWCGPCVMEMPAFERLMEDYGDEISLVAVNCGDDAETVKDFVEENGFTFPIALDEDFEITMTYPSNGIPYTVIVDSEGVITHISTGASDADTMYEQYREALGLEAKEAS